MNFWLLSLSLWSALRVKRKKDKSSIFKCFNILFAPCHTSRQGGSTEKTMMLFWCDHDAHLWYVMPCHAKSSVYFSGWPTSIVIIIKVSKNWLDLISTLSSMFFWTWCNGTSWSNCIYLNWFNKPVNSLFKLPDLRIFPL